MKNYKKLVVAGLLIAVFCVSIGFAALSTGLTIQGTATAKTTKWEVGLANPTKTGGVTPTTAPTISGTTLSYAVSLNQPGDYYEFTVQVKNTGSIDAKLSAAPTITGTSTYMTHTVTYSDGTAVAANDTLAAGATKTLKVKVVYNTNLTAAQLPTADSSTTFKIALNYVQA